MKKLPTQIYATIEDKNTDDAYIRSAIKPGNLIDEIGEEKIVGVYRLEETIKVSTEVIVKSK